MTGTSGALVVFEGPDAVGKSELSRQFARRLSELDVVCDWFAFPGREVGTLGWHIYELHHRPAEFGIREIGATSLQLLHVAAHVDAIEKRILPSLRAGRVVVLDRFWWSTVVYGAALGADRERVSAMVNLEMMSWGSITPHAVFLIKRSSPLRHEPAEVWARCVKEYDALAAGEAHKYPVHVIDNNALVDQALESLLTAAQLTRARSDSSSIPAAGQLSLAGVEAGRVRAPYAFSSLAPAQPAEVYDTYWRFAAERQQVFFRRFRGGPFPWTEDLIMRRYKFTNAYRASDRVSQYLIRSVIYAGEQSAQELFFRIILFKLFNRIETWQLLEKEIGAIRYKTYSFESYDRVLQKAIRRREPIYSSAYIMPSGGKAFRTARKHQGNLRLLEAMMKDEVPARVERARNMQEVFLLLRSYPSIGDFLAYQYATDLNYSELTNFDEMEFVVPGPGARDGIRKCFKSLGGLNEVDIIKVVAARQERECERLGLDFMTLWGRLLQLVDCQNVFCEVDKYARLRHPDVKGISGRTRIKQRFQVKMQPLEYWYPPKWGLNQRIADEKKRWHISAASSGMTMGGPDGDQRIPS